MESSRADIDPLEAPAEGRWPGPSAPRRSRRVGVLTLHRCINYGSYWQARSLVEGLRAMGHDAVIVDHDSWRFNRAEWMCGLRPLLPARSSLADSARYAVKMVRFARARATLPISDRFPLEKPADLEPLEMVVVGSDEVWNLEHPMYGACPLFFGDGVRAGRLVSYAASFGSYDAARGLDPEWADRLRGFAAIGVRDENSRVIVAAALGLEPEITLDPCLQFPVEPARPWRGPRHPFVAVYGHSFRPGFPERVRRWAQAQHLPLVSIGYRNDWADEQWLTAGPTDFAHAIARAEAVATNFFHGCVFALCNDRPFACQASPYRSNKIHGLLALLGAGAHLLPDDARPSRVEAVMTRPPGPAVRLRLEVLRRRSAAYVQRALA